MRDIPLALSQTHPCPYIEGLISQYSFIRAPAHTIHELHSSTLAAGFRRSGDLHYRQHCPECDRCKAIRVPVSEFKPNKTQRRIMRKNSHFEVKPIPWLLDETVLDLYNRYQFARHDDGEMAAESARAYENMFNSYETTDMKCLAAYDPDGTLIALAISDITHDAMSAVYTFYDPTLLTHSLGTWMILQQISYAHENDLRWLYLGYWIKDNNKMGYKEKFRPAQIYNGKVWVPIETKK